MTKFFLACYLFAAIAMLALSTTRAFSYFQKQLRVPAPPVVSAPTFEYAERVMSEPDESLWPWRGTVRSTNTFFLDEQYSDVVSMCAGIPGAKLDPRGVCILPVGEIRFTGTLLSK